MKKYRHHFIILGLFVVFWIFLAWNPTNPSNWFVENHLVFLFMPVLIFLILYARLSLTALGFIVLFLLFHVIGAHYNYGSVPFGALTGDLLGIHNNVYDRIVHFSFGLFWAYPVWELFVRMTKTKGFQTYAMTVIIILAFSSVYEILEWLSVTNLDPETAYLFIGGNDSFDTSKDMAMAGVGVMIGAVAIWAVKTFLNPHNKS